ncbi:hypothetical protein JCGZ_14835 [Jatropha curcas]|uniref:Uncharacterized protein n=1 Tax=Jatropha curcas TaxID=180498 RepID=A0A067KH74_JATCU|nr:hypothetical protein JCGZ_14835 [Jatropha curcas]
MAEVADLLHLQIASPAQFPATPSFSAIPVSKEVFFIFDKLLFDLGPASRPAILASGDGGGFR